MLFLPVPIRQSLTDLFVHRLAARPALLHECMRQLIHPSSSIYDPRIPTVSALEKAKGFENRMRFDVGVHQGSDRRNLAVYQEIFDTVDVLWVHPLLFLQDAVNMQQIRPIGEVECRFECPVDPRGVLDQAVINVSVNQAVAAAVELLHQLTEEDDMVESEGADLVAVNIMTGWRISGFFMHIIFEVIEGRTVVSGGFVWFDRMNEKDALPEKFSHLNLHHATDVEDMQDVPLKFSCFVF